VPPRKDVRNLKFVMSPAGVRARLHKAVERAISEGAGDAYLWQFLGPTKDKPFIPFPAQQEALAVVQLPWPGISEDGIPYPTIIAENMGRRFGKTTLGEKLIWRGLLAPDDQFGPPTVRLTADTEEHAQKIWRRFIWHLENTDLAALLDSHSREHNLVTLKSGATAQMLSGNNPQALSGDGVTLWIIDEAQFLSWDAWENLFPSTAERDGVIVMLGVSQGDGPFKEVSYRGDKSKLAPGETDPYPEYLRMTYPTAANPFVPRWRIDFAKRHMTPSAFKQLYLAEWSEESGKIFRGINQVFHPWPIYQYAEDGYKFVEPHQAGHDYYAGLDLARTQDWTVLVIFDRSGRLVAWDRFSQASWELQKARIYTTLMAYKNPPLMPDSTGLGDVIVEDLSRMGLNVIEDGYKITSNLRKRILIDELAIRVERQAVGFPDIPILKRELERMEARKSKTGQSGEGVIRYEAPSGMTDDFVMACSLAAQHMPKPLQLLQARRDQTPDEIEEEEWLRQIGRRRSAAEMIA
jgi:hypothetical protein